MADLLFFVERLQTPLGLLLLVTDDKGHVRALDWQEYENRMRLLFRRNYRHDSVKLLNTFTKSKALQSMADYFDGDIGVLKKIPVKTEGSEFQKIVWKALCEITPSNPISYTTLAKNIGKPRAVRAVGLANGANPIGIIVPCHRVIGANGSMTGYGGGVVRKRWLLDHENIETE